MARNQSSTANLQSVPAAQKSGFNTMEAAFKKWDGDETKHPQLPENQTSASGSSLWKRVSGFRPSPTQLMVGGAVAVVSTAAIVWAARKWMPEITEGVRGLRSSSKLPSESSESSKQAA